MKLFQSLACAASVLLLAFSTFAQEVNSSLSEALNGEAKSAYETGRLLFDDGDPAGALSKFQHAFELSKDTRLLWNMAVCEKALRHYAASAVLIDRYLVEGVNLSPEKRSSAEETLAALRSLYSKVQLENAPAGATLSVDNVSLGPIPLGKPLALDLGHHQLKLEKPGFLPFNTPLDIVGSKDVLVRIALQPAPPPKVAPLPARLVLSSSSDATLSIDGKVVGSQHWEGSLTPGQHALRITAPDKKPYEASLELASGSQRTLTIPLEDESGHVWYWVAGGAVLAAGAAAGGYFLFRPNAAAGDHAVGGLTTLYLP